MIESGGKNMTHDRSQVAIVIPIYKEKLSGAEEIALQQALRVLGRYTFYFICPKSLKYEYKNIDIKEVRFENFWFTDVRRYSELMLQCEFYRAFSAFEYILIYQLDSFVFSDQLQEFCALGYDYIGAPWIHGILHYVDANHIIHKVGNGGFSLRRVSAFIRWLHQNNLSELKSVINEDILISAYGSDVLNIPSEDTALKFSFDLDPKGCYEKNNYQLPFGCHAWLKYDLDFWRPFIEKEGFSLSNIYPNGLGEKYQRRYELEDERNEYIQKILCKSVKMVQVLTCGNKKLFIWGTGLWGTLVAHIFEELNIAIDGFVDNHCKSDVFMGYNLVSGEDFLKRKPCQDAILVAVMQSESIELQLQHSGYVHNLDYQTLKDFDSN